MSKPSFSYFLILFTIALQACGGDASSGSSDAAVNEPTHQMQSSQHRDSIRQLYQQLLAAKKDTLPLRQIREVGKLYPVDEAPQDTAFFIFREQLLQTIQRREVFHLMDIIHPEIKADFGGSGGVADFVSMWELDSPEKAKNSKVWETLAKVLQNGGAFQNGGKRFVAPYIFATWPDTYDAFEYSAITGSGVRLRSAPNLQSRTLTMVNYDIVKVLETTPIEETIGGETFPWVKIQLANETEGYVFGKFVASSVGFRAAFERQPNGKWLMTFLVAGD